MPEGKGHGLEKIPAGGVGPGEQEKGSRAEGGRARLEDQAVVVRPVGSVLGDQRHLGGHAPGVAHRQHPALAYDLRFLRVAQQQMREVAGPVRMGEGELF